MGVAASARRIVSLAYLRVDVLTSTNSDNAGNTSGADGANNRFTNDCTRRSREDLNIDTRTAIEYGVARSYARQANGSSVYWPLPATPMPVVSHGLVAGGSTITGVNQFTYTAQFGNDVPLSLLAQDQTTYSWP